MITHHVVLDIMRDEVVRNQSTLCLLLRTHLITLASSGHKMARGSLPAVEAGRLLACGGEHSGHAMLGTATA